MALFFFFCWFIIPCFWFQLQGLSFGGGSCHCIDCTSFFGGLSFDRSLLNRSGQLKSSVQLAVLVAVFIMAFWFFYLRLGIGIFQSWTGCLEGVKPNIVSLISMIIIASIAVQDWNLFAFISGKIKDFESIVSDIF
tara:strand:- start:466 stop:873 length:408 start_codon:yes stop_codon:yes gene_type:complete